MNKKEVIIAKFIEALGDPTKYNLSYYYDAGLPVESCVCGHQIRHCFVITDGTRTALVGCECIYHFKSYSPALYSSLVEANQKRMKEDRERKKRIKELAVKEELKNLLGEYKKYSDRLHEIYRYVGGDAIRIDYVIWLAHSEYWKGDCELVKFGKYKRTSTYINKITENIKELKTVILEIEAMDLKEYIKPEKQEAPKYEGILWFGKYSGEKLEDVKPGYRSWLFTNYTPQPWDQRQVDFYNHLATLVS